MMFFFLVLVCGIAVVGCLFFGYHYVLQQRANARRPHNVTVQFRRSSGISSPSSAAVVDTTSITPRRRAIPQFEAVSPVARNGSATMVRNRNESRPSGVSFISPNSMYGYMPKANILNEARKPQKELKKEFTVKLAPFPQLNRSLMNQSGNSFSMSTLNSPNESNNSFNNNSLNSNTHSFMMNGSIPQHQQSTSNEQRPTPTLTTNAPRVSNKRPIFLNDSSEDEINFKKLKNQIIDDMDQDDSEMFDEQAASESIIGETVPKKGSKRPTLPFENDIQLNSPLKRVKDNEIFSSTSESTESSSTQNKRKFQSSPEKSASSSATVKKRTYIEELELLTSDQSPYYKNIYNTVPTESSSATTQPSSTPLPSLLSSSDQSQQGTKSAVATPTMNGQTNGQLTAESDVIDLIDDDSDDDDDDISLHSDTTVPVPDDEDDEENGEITELPTPQISEQVFSIKDHEYDKKKSKNRLNRFLAAVQQGTNESTLTEPAEKKAISILVNSSPATFTLPSKLTNGTVSNAKAKDIVIASTSSSASALPVPPVATFAFGASAPASSNGIITFGAKPKPPTGQPQLTTTIELVKDPLNQPAATPFDSSKAAAAAPTTTQQPPPTSVNSHTPFVTPSSIIV